LVALGVYTSMLPSMYPDSSFWTSSPTFFAIRVGMLMVLLAATYAIGRACEGATRALQPLERLGRRSLFVYWIHVELIYGYATWLIHGGFQFAGPAAAYGMFRMLM